MKAAWTPQYGDPTIIELCDRPEPTVAANSVVVQVHASPITAGDLRLRSANFPGISAVFGRLLLGVFAPKRKVQGTMFAGSVVAVGTDVTRFAVGDAVFGAADAGAWAERIVVDADGAIAHRPTALTPEAAASLPYGAGSALHFLEDIAKVQPDEHVLILGASGGVGRFAIQIAKHLGARVTAVGSGDTLELMRELGADEVMDYRTQDFTQSGELYDVVLDIADRSSFGQSKSALTPKGRYVTLYISIRAIMMMGWTALMGGKRALFSIAVGDRDQTETLAELAWSGAVRPVIAERFPLDRIVEAHEVAETGVHGSVIVNPTAPTLECGALQTRSPPHARPVPCATRRAALT